MKAVVTQDGTYLVTISVELLPKRKQDSSQQMAANIAVTRPDGVEFLALSDKWRSTERAESVHEELVRRLSLPDTETVFVQDIIDSLPVKR